MINILIGFTGGVAVGAVAAFYVLKWMLRRAFR